MMVVAALFATTTAAQAATSDIGNSYGVSNAAKPHLQNLLGPVAPFRDSVLKQSALSRFAQTSTLDHWWGGTATATDGTTMTIYSSNWYRQSGNAATWANYFTWLLHGPELTRLTLYFAPLFEVQAICGDNAVGCYSPVTQAMVVPGDRSYGMSMEQIIAHEYGHHIEANRDNAPWNASDWGPKYWASNAGVCQRVQSGTAYPGDEGAHYSLNPAEAFAESYRLLTVSRAASTATWGPILPFGDDQSFSPSSAAFAAVARDVMSPWIGSAVNAWSGVFTKRRHLFRQRIVMDADGLVTVSLSQAPGGSVITLADGSTGAILASSRNTISVTACGHESFVMGVGTRNRGRFVVSVSKA
jgi:hypothetical protein